jgi:hypothetical protein
MGTPEETVEGTIPMRVRLSDRDRIFQWSLRMSADKGRRVEFPETVTEILDRLEKAEARDE